MSPLLVLVRALVVEDGDPAGEAGGCPKVELPFLRSDGVLGVGAGNLVAAAGDLVATAAEVAVSPFLVVGSEGSGQNSSFRVP